VKSPDIWRVAVFGVLQFRNLLALLVVVSVACLAMLGAALRTSATFDEITMVALGARGYATGQFNLMPQHPPGAQYLYGLPVFVAGVEYPAENLATVANRYDYAKEFYWSLNNPKRIALLSRGPAILMALALTLLSFRVASELGGPGAGLLAATLVAFLPDVLAHGAVAYSDVPLALAYLASVWTLDRAIRDPSASRGVLAGAAVAFALGMKFSAVLVGPVALILIVAEATNRVAGERWHRDLRRAAVAGLLTTYGSLVLMYGGDFLLSDFLSGLYFTFGHVTEGHDHPAFLLGKTSILGWRYFYPVAFLLKTPIALHALIVLLIVRLLRTPVSWRSLATSPLRAIVVGAGVFGVALLASSLNIGFRYALPLLPLVCILVAIGTVRLAARSQLAVRTVMAVLVTWYVVAALSFYPHYLTYTSEYIPDPDDGYRALVDSNLDWGQGRLELRSWMKDNDVSRVALSYFGSAPPAGYGIGYVPLESFFALDEPLPGEEELGPPSHVVISATNLQGVYLDGDPFAHYRRREPITVLAHTMFVYDAD
jgi:hypothetical protein